MKKLFASFAIMAICSFAAQAQDELSPANVPTTPKEKTNVGPRREALSPNPRINQRKEEMQEKFKNATPEEKERMIKRRQDKTPRKENVNKERTAFNDQKAKLDHDRKLFEKLTLEQKDELKNENLRHRSEVKRITGVEEINMPFDN